MERITTTQQFDELLARSGRTIVKFYTTWCPDCHRIDKAWEEYAESHKEQANFADLNCEEVREVADRYDVKGIPSFLVYEQGQLVDRLYSRDAKTVKQVTDFADKALAEVVKG